MLSDVKNVSNIAEPPNKIHSYLHHPLQKNKSQKGISNLEAGLVNHKTHTIKEADSREESKIR